MNILQYEWTPYMQDTFILDIYVQFHAGNVYVNGNFRT